MFINYSLVRNRGWWGWRRGEMGCDIDQQEHAKYSLTLTVCHAMQRRSTILGPKHTGHFVEPHVAAHCGGDIYSRMKPLFSSFGEHTAVCGSSVRQAVARPRHRQSVCIHNIHVAATCRPSVLGSATMRGHMCLNKVASVLGPLNSTRMMPLQDITELWE